MLGGIISGRSIIAGLGLGVASLAVVGLLADFRLLQWHLERFPKVALLIALVLTLTNYLLRLVRWHWLVNRLGGRVPWSTNVLIFISGLSMVITPGKLGELLKSYLLKIISRIPVPRSVPIVFAERLYDGIAMVVLSLLGLFSFRTGWVPVLGFAALAFALVLVLSKPSAWDKILGRASKLPILQRGWQDLLTVLDSSYRLTRLGVLVPAVATGVASWFCECVAFYLILTGLGLPWGKETLLLATFVLAVSTLVGSLSMLPGGVGAAELTISGLLVGIGGLSMDMAGVATILIRLVTLWFGTVLGLIGLGITSFALREGLGEPSKVLHE